MIPMKPPGWTLIAAGVFWVLPSTASGTEEGCSTAGRFSSSRNASASIGDPGIDVSYYRLDLHVDHVNGTLRGDVRVAASVVADTLHAVTLDLSASMTVDSVRLGQTRPVFVRLPTGFTVQLPTPHTRGEHLTLDIAYHGAPASTGFGSFVFSSALEGPWVWSLSQPYGARDWWPCKDHPLDKADSVDILVTCASGLKVGSNGRLVSVRDNGDGTTTHTWTERYPIATYLVSVAIAPYAEFSNWFKYGPQDSMEVLNYVLPHHLELAQSTLPRTVDMLEVFSRLYGPYPFLNEKYGHSEFGRGGAMEHQTMTSTTTFDEDVIAHELAHQWFGDLITCRTWQDLWLNEGFATYSESLYREARYGGDQYRALIRNRMHDAMNARGSLFVQDTSSVPELFARSRVYSKGASVLHMLRHVMGDTLFFKAIRAYAGDPRFRYGTASTSDFQSVCESYYGRSLGFFFTQWVYGENYPRYTLRWTAQTEGTSFLIDAMLEQETGTTNPSAFVMPVDLRFSAAGQETTVVVWNSQNPEQFTVPLPFRPERAEVDPDQWILREVIDPGPVLPTTAALAQNFPNPFNNGTSIRIQIPHRTHVTLSVHNVLGQRIETLVDGVVDPGTHEYQWTPGVALQDPGTVPDRPVASGVYYCRLATDGAFLTRSMIFIR
ncbi:MAG: peptidase M1 [Bacteroidetes bacterium]|nr:peptidase M1 [Bacteroidota bacterium]